MRATDKKLKPQTEIRVQKPCDTDQIKLYHEMTDNQTERELDKTKKYKFYCTTPTICQSVSNKKIYLVFRKLKLKFSR